MTATVWHTCLPTPTDEHLITLQRGFANDQFIEYNEREKQFSCKR